MYKDGIFVFDNVTSANLSELTLKHSVICERRICEISDLANEIVFAMSDMIDDGYGMYEMLSIISEGSFPWSSDVNISSLPQNSKRIENSIKLLSSQDKAILSDLVTDKLKEKGYDINERDFLPEESGDERITYVKNVLSDEAFDVFSQELSEPRVMYSSSFSDAVRAVSSGTCEYCLLPLEERGGARLAAVAELLFKEDLRINSVTPVFGPEGAVDMKYALVSKHFTVPEINDGDDRYLELRIRGDNAIEISELLAAADTLNIKPYRINTISFETEDGYSPYYSIVFKDDGKDFSPFLFFLTLFAGDYTTVGIYKNLE